MRVSWMPTEGGKTWGWDGLLDIHEVNVSLSAMMGRATGGTVSLFLSRAELVALRDGINVVLGEATDAD